MRSKDFWFMVFLAFLVALGAYFIPTEPPERSSIEVTFEGERWEYATVQIDAPPIGSDEWHRLGQYGIELPTGVTIAYDLTGERPTMVHVYTLEIDVPGQRSRHATRSFEVPRNK